MKIGCAYTKHGDQLDLVERTVNFPHKDGIIESRIVKISKAKLDVIESISQFLIYNFDKFVDYKEKREKNGDITYSGKIQIEENVDKKKGE
jgi:hypothetical protein